MKTDNNYVRSGQERLVDDDYKTIDTRCMAALLDTMGNDPNVGWSRDDSFIDVCSPSGSGILDYLRSLGVYNVPWSDALSDNFPYIDWIITNPPYKRGLVDEILRKQIYRLHGGINRQVQRGVAALLRTQFDHAKSREDMFRNNTFYAGQIKMMFRPVWFKDTETTPIHSFVWHLWLADWNGKPHQIWYW